MVWNIVGRTAQFLEMTFAHRCICLLFRRCNFYICVSIRLWALRVIWMPYLCGDESLTVSVVYSAQTQCRQLMCNVFTTVVHGALVGSKSTPWRRLDFKYRKSNCTSSNSNEKPAGIITPYFRYKMESTVSLQQERIKYCKNKVL